VLACKVTRVGNQESEEVPFHAIFSTSSHATELFGHIYDFLVEELLIVFVTLEENSAGSHFISVEALDIEHIELLHSFDKVVEHRVARWLESLSKLELSVVHQSDRGRVHGRLCNGMHELNADFKVWEQDRIVDAHLRQRLDLDNCVGENSDVTFTAHNHVVEIGSVGDTGPEGRFGVGATG